MKFVFAALIGATAAASVKADCDLTKLKVATFTDNACATAATGAGAEAALRAFLEANKGSSNSNTIGAVNSNNLCVQAYQAGDTGAAQKFTFLFFQNSLNIKDGQKGKEGLEQEAWRENHQEHGQRCVQR